MSKNLHPMLCMNRDKNILKFCLENISMSEPCSVLEVNGFGARVIYYELLKKLTTEEVRVVNFLNAMNSKELHGFLNKISKETRSQIVVIYLSSEEDCSWFIKELDGLRDKRNTDFVSVVFARIGDVFDSLKTKQKIIFRSIKIIEPVSKGDAQLLVSDFNRRFNYDLSGKLFNRIYDISCGHVGLFKSIYLLLKNNPDIVISDDILLKEPSIVSRLEGIIMGLPDEFVKDLYFYPNAVIYKNDIEMFNFVINGQLVPLILKKYLKNKYGFNDNVALENNMDSSLTQIEKNIMDKIIIDASKIYSREEIAEIIWGNGWEERYSDWAIDQTMHRLRLKLNNSNSNFTIETKKGRGFILRKL
jgi:hypothetical protein